MTLATRCPACGTIFRLGTREAGARGGIVRCGVCEHVFNALDTIVRAGDLPKTATGAGTPAAFDGSSSSAVDSAARQHGQSRVDTADSAGRGEVPSIEPIDARNSHEDEREKMPLEAQGEGAIDDASPLSSQSNDSAEPPPAPEIERGSSSPQDQPPESDFDSHRGVAPSDESESIDPPTPTSAPWSDAPTESSAAAPRESDAASTRFDPLFAETPGEGAAEGGVAAPSPKPMPPWARAGAADGPPSHSGPTFPGFDPARSPSSRRRVYAVLSALAAIALVSQAVYLWRAEIAASLPWTRPGLRAACAVLNCRVELPLRIEQISIESSDLVAVPATDESYVFRALLRNRGRTGVRYPALELTLTDVSDRAVVRRVIAPREYLPASTPIPAPPSATSDGIGPNTELPIKIAFDVRGEKIAGFRVGVFYP